jgi:hypothetical protein
MSSLNEQLPWREALYHDPLPIGGIAVGLMLGTYWLFQLPVSVPLLVAGGCGAALVYGVDRGLLRSPEDEINHPRRRKWVRTRRGWLMAEGILCLLVGAGALAFLRSATVLAVGGLAVLAALHLLPLERGDEPLPLVGMVKPVIVASAWAIGGTILPMIEARMSIGAGEGLFTGYRLLFILPNVLLADWADRRGDAAVGLQSWTQGVTGRRVRWVATGLLVLAGAGAILVASHMVPVLPLLVDSIGLLLMAGAVWRLSPGHPGHRLLMDAIVAWPFVPAFVAWILG